jgi:hypothetical protein
VGMLNIWNEEDLETASNNLIRDNNLIEIMELEQVVMCILVIKQII